MNIEERDAAEQLLRKQLTEIRERISIIDDKEVISRLKRVEDDLKFHLGQLIALSI
jgi:hypothetical protein